MLSSMALVERTPPALTSSSARAVWWWGWTRRKCRAPLAQVQGGGNAANALTAAARLGLKPTLVTKVRSQARCRRGAPGELHSCGGVGKQRAPAHRAQELNG